jgi:hypothetical protein
LLGWSTALLTAAETVRTLHIASDGETRKLIHAQDPID